MITVSILILGAGKSSRMHGKSKLLHDICGFPIIESVYRNVKIATKEIDASIDINIITNDTVKNDIMEIINELDKKNVFIQDLKLHGTGGAIESFLNQSKNIGDFLLIIPGDVPLITPQTIHRAISVAIANKNGSCVYFMPRCENAQYGKIYIENNIIKECIENTLANLPCNSGLIVLNSQILKKYINKLIIQPNNEKYITDIFKILYSDNINIEAIEANEDECVGVNTAGDLRKAFKIANSNAINRNMQNGCIVYDVNSLFLSQDTQIGHGTIIYPNVFIGRGTIIKENCIILPYTHLEGCTIEANCKVGPFARIRPKTHLHENVKVGNFTEIKNSEVKSGTKINHSSYIGDAYLGEKVNIGANAVICNYDGVNKHITHIGDNAFIGSNSSIISPRIVDGFVAAGTVVVDDVKKDELAISRVKQVNKKYNIKSKNKKQ